MTLDEKALLLKAGRDKDTKAFSQLYDLCAPAAYNLACRMLKNETEAQDIVQQAFLSLWDHAHEFQSERAKVSTWLHVFVRNRSIDFLRRKKSQPLLISTSSTDDDLPSFDISDSSPSIEEQLTVKEHQNQIRSALDQLTQEQRVVIEIAYFEGQTQQEISDRLKEPLGTIKTRMRLGLQKLARLIKKEPEISR